MGLRGARRRLYLSFAQSRMLHGQTRYGIASRFFQEIPENLMRRINPASSVQRSAHSGRGSRGAGTESRATSNESLRGDSPWRIGQSVVHPAFGAGVIVSAEGRGADARVQVNFRDGGLKWLALEDAKLIPA